MAISRLMTILLGTSVRVAALLGVAASAHAQTLPYTPYNTQDVAWLGTVKFFAAADAVHGVELWRSDGTAAGTYAVADLWPGAAGSYPQSLTTMNGRLYFSANDGVYGAELWSSDGTPQGTSLVADIAPGEYGANPHFLTAVDGLLFFEADNPVSGAELWSSDGTASGTLLVKDIASGSVGSFPTGLTNFDGVLVFGADDGTSHRQLWASDGTAAHTVLLKAINPFGNASPSDFTASNGLLYFVASDAMNGFELWCTDGTGEGTRLVSDINPGAADSRPHNLVDYNGRLYFLATDGAGAVGLWQSGGTDFTTTLVSTFNGSAPQQLSVKNGRLSIVTGDPTPLYSTWISDGSSAGTMPAALMPLTTATISWAPVTSAADGSPLTDLGGYRVYFGPNPGALVSSIDVPDPAKKSLVVSGLMPGVYYFAVTSYIRGGLESNPSASLGMALSAGLP